MTRITLLLVLSFAVAPAAQAVYKWVDEKGVTQYSESPPPGRPSTKVDVKPPGPSGAEGSSDNWRQRELESRRQRAAKERQEDRDKAQEDSVAAQRRSRCRQAKHELEVLEKPRPVYQRNERDEKVYIPDKDRLGRIEVLRQRVAEWCDR